MSQNKFDSCITHTADWAFFPDHSADFLGPYSGCVFAKPQPASPWVDLPPQRITGDYGGPFDLFGHSIATSNGRLFVGAPLQDLGAQDSGSVHVFSFIDRSWREEALLLPDVARTCLWFGSTLAADGDRLAVSAPSAGDHCGNSGEVYVFECEAGDWMLIEKKTSSLPAALYSFGSELDLEGDRLSVTSRPRPFCSGGNPIVAEYRITDARRSVRTDITASCDDPETSTAPDTSHHPRNAAPSESNRSASGKTKSSRARSEGGLGSTELNWRPGPPAC